MWRAWDELAVNAYWAEAYAEGVEAGAGPSPSAPTIHAARQPRVAAAHLE